MTALRHELEAPAPERRFGSGWISGVLALALALAGLAAVLCLRYPDLLTVPDLRKVYDLGLVRLALHLALVAGFALAIVSLVLRPQKALPLTAVAVVLLATLLGGSRAQARIHVESPVYLGLDWFVLNLIFTGLVFIPIERFLGTREQPIFRHEWREDLLYFLVNSLLIQALTFLSMAPSLAILHNTDWATFRAAVASQPFLLQLLEIMFLTDLVQYWVHRAFHRVPFLWKMHSIHHSAEVMDWLAGSRMHLLEVVFLRGTTLIPMYVLGFSQPALYAYIFFVYLFSTLVHSNLRVSFGPLEYGFVTPRYHHWHHGVEREAIDVNFAVHFPILDRLFGTYYYPSDGRWPSGYGIAHNPPPKGYWRQLLSPFVRRRPAPADKGAVPE